MNQVTSFDAVRSNLRRTLAITTRLDHQDGVGAPETALGLIGRYTADWIDHLARHILTLEFMHPYPTSEAQKLIDDATEAALDAGCKVIQERLGIKHGDLAGLHFDRRRKDVLRDLFAAYLLEEVKELDDTRVFELDSRTCSLFDMLLAHEADRPFLEWLFVAKPGDVFQGCRCLSSSA